MDIGKAVVAVGELMAISARTAPKATGSDFIEIELLKGDDLKALADGMRAYGIESGKKNFDRDARGVDASNAVLLLGLRQCGGIGLNCGSCGFATCAELIAAHQEFSEFAGPNCAWKMQDLGIALGSAVKTASIHNVDNRIMYRIGVVARKLGMIKADTVIGVPLSATGKSPFFDR
jgi:uncharacterized ferredoxin-like protein